MCYTDRLLCFIIKAAALGLQTLCPLSVCCVAEMVLILNPICPSMPHLKTDTHTNTNTETPTVQHLQTYKYKYTEITQQLYYKIYGKVCGSP